MTRRGPRRLTGSLRARVIAAATGSILIAVALFGGAAVMLVGRQLHSSLDRALRQRAEDVALLSVSAPAVLTAPGALESPVSGRQIVVEVLDAHGRILARSEALGAQLLPQGRLEREAIGTGRTGFEDVSLDGRQFRVYAAPIADAGGPAAGGAVLRRVRHLANHEPPDRTAGPQRAGGGRARGACRSRTDAAWTQAPARAG